MITITTPPTTRPIKIQEALAFLGLPIDEHDDVVETLLAGAIDDVERIIGAGIGVSSVTATIYAPFPSRLMLPYGPLAVDEGGNYRIAITSVDEVAGSEMEYAASDFIIRNHSPVIVIPRSSWPNCTCLELTYTGGYESPPAFIKSLILRTVAARYEARSMTIEPDIVPVTEDGYLAAWR